MFHVPYAKVVSMSLTSHQLRIQESNFAFYFFGSVLLSTCYESWGEKNCMPRGAAKAFVHVWIWELGWENKQEGSTAEH